MNKQAVDLNKELVAELKAELADYSTYGRVEIIRHWLVAQAYKFNFTYTRPWARGNGNIILAK